VARPLLLRPPVSQRADVPLQQNACLGGGQPLVPVFHDRLLNSCFLMSSMCPPVVDHGSAVITGVAPTGVDNHAGGSGDGWKRRRLIRRLVHDWCTWGLRWACMHERESGP